jgi:hypothetical protein
MGHASTIGMLGFLPGACSGRPAWTSMRDADRSTTKPFSEVATEFAKAWDSGDIEPIEGYVDPGHGLWLLYDPSIAECPVQHRSVGDAIAKGPDAIQAPNGMGPHLRKAAFNCDPKPGAAPSLGNCEHEQPDSTCSFGSARPVLRDSFGFCTDVSKSAGLPPGQVEHALSLEQRGAHFLSDSTTGAVFYFVAISSRWLLVAIDNTDCTIHRRSEDP